MSVAAGRLEGKVVLITGAAGSIGAATASLFAAEGAAIVMVDADTGALERATPLLGPDVAARVAADVTDAGGVADAVRTAVESFGGLDVAFANAGVFGEVAPVTDYPDDVFERVMAVNVMGSFLLAKHALRAMREGGSLIFNSSVVGLTSDAGIAAYATSKHAVVGLMRTLVSEVADRGIRVNTLHPGPVDNEFQRRVEVDATGAAADEAARLFEERIPLRRHAAPEEVARAALFLASDESAFVTGARLAVDGGMSV